MPLKFHKLRAHFRAFKETIGAYFEGHDKLSIVIKGYISRA